MHTIIIIMIIIIMLYYISMYIFGASVGGRGRPCGVRGGSRGARRGCAGSICIVGISISISTAC